MSPSNESDSEDSDDDGDEGDGELRDYGYDSEDGREAGQHMMQLLIDLSENHGTVRYAFSAAVKEVRINDQTDDPDRALTIVFDRVTWNDDFTDGGTAEPTLNPVHKWETLHSGEVVALMSPGSGRLALSSGQLASLVDRRMHEQGGGPTYFSFYFSGQRLVALDEWFLP